MPGPPPAKPTRFLQHSPGVHPGPAPTTSSSLVSGITRPPKDASRLYAAGYFAAWLGLLSFVGVLVFESVAKPPDGYVSTFNDVPIVIVLRAYFSVTFLAAWIIAGLVAKRVPREGSFPLDVVVLLSCGGPLAGVIYLFAALPTIRPGRSNPGA